MRLRLCPLVAGGLLTGTLLVGVSAPASGAGISAKQAVANAIAATESVTSIRTSDSIFVGKKRQSLAVIFGNNQGVGMGRIVSGKASVNVRLVNRTIYLKGTAAYWQQQGGSSAAQLFANKWVSLSATSKNGKQLARNIDSTSHLKLFFPASLKKWAFSYAGRSRVNGQEARIVIGRKKNSAIPPQHIFIASSGPAYILKAAVSSGSQSETVIFSSFNRPVSISAPKHAVNVNKLK